LSGSSSDWRLLRERGAASALFGPRDFGGVPTVVHCSVTAPALVLGSTQPAVEPGVVDVVRRRSGGGAVYVAAEDVVWVDVFLPAGHALWDDDVGRAFWWLGDAWAAALESLGERALSVHRGPLVSTRWSRAVCFAGVGPGEVVRDGRKVVGMAQRRSREGALFQCAAALAWQPELLAALLGLGEDAAADLSGAVSPLGPVRADQCVMALLDHLP
jgi:lipoate---protein ligase